MSNQTIAAVPYDVTDTVSLNRFFRELVDNLDIVLGYKGSSEGYVSNKEQAQTLSEIRNNLEALDEAKTLTAKDISDLKESIEELLLQVEKQDSTVTKPALGTDYYDFNFSGWDNLAGSYTISADGADISNSPFTASSGTTYNVFISAVDTGDDAHHQITVNKSAPEVYARWGTAGGWVKLG